MTTFQSIIYAIAQSISSFFPISNSAHHQLIPYLLNWQPATGALMTAIATGSLLALLFFFRQDWASMISCFLQVILFRKRPMTLDERLPLFIALTTVPSIFANYYAQNHFGELGWTPVAVATVLISTGFLLGMFDYLNRKFKGMFDWKWLDALVLGLTQATAVLPGWDAFSGLLLGAFFLNYRREAAAKYAYFALLPLLTARTISGLREINFHNSAPMPDLTWLSFGVAFIVSLLVGLLTIGAFMKHIQNKGMGRFVGYRCVLGVAVLVTYWMKNYL